MMGKSGVETERGSHDDRERIEVTVPAGMMTRMRFKKLMGKSGVETDRGSNDDTERNGVMVPAGMKTSVTFKTLKRWMEQGGNLLPGILDDITLNHISTKLSWRDVHVLSSVSAGWQQALQNSEIYNSRVDSYSTETLAVILYMHNGHYFPKEGVHLSLYSSRDNYSYELPPFPFGKGLPFGSKFLSLDRKIYVLGGRIHQPTWGAKTGQLNSNVYVLDLATKQWKQCANMSEPRRGKVAAAALKGKIYVFGGHSVKSCCPISACEVYDPKIDAWSPMKPMPLCRYNHEVAKMGDELFVYGGKFWPDVTQLIDLSEHTREPSISAVSGRVRFLDVYHPVKHEWRRIIPSDVSDWDTVFTARGKFHRMNPRGIDVYDIEKDTWSLLHTFQDVADQLSLPGCNLAFSVPGCTIALDDELLCDYWSLDIWGDDRVLFQSKGFGGKDRAITWKEVDKNDRFAETGSQDHMISIQL